MINPGEGVPEWLDGKTALVVWRRENSLSRLELKEVMVIEPAGSYRDPETELPISGSDLFKKLTESKKGWKCLGVFMTNEQHDGVSSQKLKAVIARFPRLTGY